MNAKHSAPFEIVTGPKLPTLREPLVMHLVQKFRRGESRALDIHEVAASVVRLSNGESAE
jgi:hypothetical protein